MTHATVEKWGKNLAVRLPLDVVRSTGMQTGEKVDIEVRDGDVVMVIRRPEPNSTADAMAAAEEIIRESENYTLDAAEILDMVKEGRRG